MSSIPAVQPAAPYTPTQTQSTSEASLGQSVADQVFNSPAGKQVMSNLLNDINSGAKQAMEQMPKLGEPDEDEPDPDGELGD
jgi:hypothetical protein